MSNSLLTIDMITNKSLAILHNNLAFARNVNRQYDDSFAQSGAKIGDSLRVRLPNKYTVSDGPGMTAQNTVDTAVTVTVGTWKTVAMDFTSKELTLQIDDFAERIIAPAMSVLASKVDADGLALYKDIYQSVGTPGTTPSTSLTLLQAQQKMNEMATPMDGQRSLVVNPAANAALVDGMKGMFNPGGVLDSQFKRGMLANNILDFNEIAMDQNVAMHTEGATRLTTPIVATTSASGDTTLAISGTGTWLAKKGDVFTIADVYAVNPENFTSTGSLQQFVVTADVTVATTGTVAVSPAIISSGAYQTVNSLPAAGAALVILGSASGVYPQNLAFHKDAFTLVTADLELPPGGGAVASRKVMDGISMRIWRQGDIFNSAVPCRVDILYGWKTLRATQACRIWG